MRLTEATSVLFCLLPAVSAAGAPLRFVDRAQAAGLSAIRSQGGSWFGAGVAFVDLDADGWPDLYIGQAAKSPDLFCRNQRNGRFDCAPAGPVNPEDTLAIAAGDVDNDGDLDLYVMRGGFYNALLLNDGRANFIDATKATHTEGDPTRVITPTGTFLDYDRDGKLDLYLGHWYRSSVVYTARDQLLRQQADGTFVDVTMQAGIDDRARSTLAMIAFDYDLDGWQDLYVTGDFAQSQLFHNEGGRFVEVTASQPLGFATYVTEGMGIDIGDVDGNGWPDIFVTSGVAGAGGVPYQQNGSALFINQGDGTFINRGTEWKVNGGFAWGSGVVDFDNDGWPDLFVATSAVPNHSLYQNLTGGAFAEQKLGENERINNQCVTVAFADYDRDGRVDLLLHRIDGLPLQLWHNETVSGHYLDVFIATGELGTRVRVTAAGRSQERELLSQSSHGSQSDRQLHFGIGAATRAELTVTFPDGKTVALGPLEADQLVAVGRQGRASLSVAAPAGGCGVTGGGRSGSSLWVTTLGLLFFNRAVRMRVRTRSRTAKEYASMEGIT